QSGSDKCFLRESKAAATNVSCAKAKRQRQMFPARKQSGSDKCFLRESEAAAIKAHNRNGNQPLACRRAILFSKTKNQ
ncbi:hypothetical protein ACQKMV_22190, partial [Lysinibacillus sp. NPDC094403]|uniref:hypothetical protein n=1 Tax=Lysinibacillus sp. NPDC094403 TaxID=3390581 RepID=UPI003CFC5CC8